MTSGELGSAWDGARALLRGLALVIRDARVRRFVLLPFGIAVAVWLALAGGFLYFGGALFADLWARPDSSLALTLWWIARVLFEVGALFALAIVSMVVSKLSAGPIYDRLVAELFSRHGIAFDDQGIQASIMNELTLLLRFGVPALILGAISLIPGAGLFVAPFAFVITALGLGASISSVALMGRGMSEVERARLRSRTRAFHLGLGATAAVIALVPLAGVLGIPAAIAGFADAYAERLASKIDRT